MKNKGHLLKSGELFMDCTSTHWNLSTYNVSFSVWYLLLFQSYQLCQGHSSKWNNKQRSITQQLGIVIVLKHCISTWWDQSTYKVLVDTYCSFRVMSLTRKCRRTDIQTYRHTDGQRGDSGSILKQGKSELTM